FAQLHSLAAHALHLPVLTEDLNRYDEFVELYTLCDGRTYLIGLCGHFGTRATIQDVNAACTGTHCRACSVHCRAASSHYRDVPFKPGLRVEVEVLEKSGGRNDLRQIRLTWDPEALTALRSYG